MVGFVGMLVIGCDPTAPPVNPNGPPALCAKRFSGDADQDVSSLGVDAAGNFVIAGSNNGTVDFGDGSMPIGSFVAKFDPNCQHVWSKPFPRGFQPEMGPTEPGLYKPRVAVDPAGNVIVSSCFFVSADVGGGPLTDAGLGDMLLFKLDASGTHLWSKRFGDVSRCTKPPVVSTDAAGNILLTADSGGQETVDFGGGPITPPYIVKLSGDGEYIWSKPWAVNSLGTDASGNVVISGGLSGTMNFGGNPLTASDNADLFVAKLGSDGSHIWSKAFPTTTFVGDGMVVTMAVAPPGEIVLAGALYGTVDFGGGLLTQAGGGDACAAKLDANGEHLYSKRIGDAGRQYVDAVAIDSGGNVALAGLFDGSFDFGEGSITNAYLARVASDMSAIWGKGDGYDDRSPVEAVGFDAAGNAIIAGRAYGTIDFGNGALMGPPDGSDVIIAKFAP